MSDTLLLPVEGQVLVDAVYEILPEIPDISIYLQGSTDEQKQPPFCSFQKIMSAMPNNSIDRAVRKSVTYATPAVYIYTSGTTGNYRK